MYLLLNFYLIKAHHFNIENAFPNKKNVLMTIKETAQCWLEIIISSVFFHSFFIIID